MFGCLLLYSFCCKIVIKKKNISCGRCMPSVASDYQINYRKIVNSAIYV